MQNTEESLIHVIKKYTTIKQIDTLQILGGGKENNSYIINSDIFLQINNNINSEQQNIIEKICNSGFSYFAKNIKNNKRFYKTDIGCLQIMELKKGRTLTKDTLNPDIITGCFEAISKTTAYLQNFHHHKQPINLEHKDNILLIGKLTSIKKIHSKVYHDFFTEESKLIPNLSYFTQGLVHGDVNYRNILENEGRIVGIIDYEATHTSSILFDLADFLRSICKFGLVDNILIQQALIVYKQYNTLTHYEEEYFIFLIKYLIINTGLRYYLAYHDETLPYFKVLTPEEKKQGFIRCIEETVAINKLIKERYNTVKILRRI